MYSISCYIDKVVVNGKGVGGIQIRPIGRSRIDGSDNQCLGFPCDDEKKAQVFDLSLQFERRLKCVALMARMCGKEVELHVNESAPGKVAEMII